MSRRRWLIVLVATVAGAACQVMPDAPAGKTGVEVDAADAIYPTDARDASTACNGPRSRCSTGTPYAVDQRFPQLDRDPDKNPEPECVPRCGDTSGAHWNTAEAWPTESALPTGRCDYDGERCQMLAVQVCCPKTDPLNGLALMFTCRCQGATWTCAGTWWGGGICEQCYSPPDAGED